MRVVTLECKILEDEIFQPAAGRIELHARQRTRFAPQLLAGLDVFVLPSLFEGISNTILEAMACGLPVVATHTGGNPELVVDGETGQLVPPAAPDVLADAMAVYLRAPDLARRHGAAAQSPVGQPTSKQGCHALP
jgi:glycosyltransferase involved in cell wall biosynthesis